MFEFLGVTLLFFFAVIGLFTSIYLALFILSADA